MSNTVTKTEVESIVSDVEHFTTLPTKSAQIRYLNSIGKSRSEIVKILSVHYNKTILYQHVRNILITPLTSK